MFAVCWALANATELSDSTFAATAALTGAATFALMSDMAARSGSSSPASSESSSRVSGRYSWGLFSAISLFPPVCGFWWLRRSVRLRDRGVLAGVRDRRRAVGDGVQGDRGVHRRRDVGVEERHRRALGQLLAGELRELLARQRPVLLGLVRHASLLQRLLWSIGVCCCAAATAAAPSDRTLAATAALIGIATLAFTSDMAARSGSSSPASSASSSRVSGLYWSGWLLIAPPRETGPGCRPGVPGPRPPRRRRRSGSPTCSAPTACPSSRGSPRRPR